MNSNGYSNLSKDEIYLISRAEYEKQLLITARFAQNIFPDKNRASKVLASLARKKRFIRLEKGKYLLVPFKAPMQQWMPNEFIVPGLWMEDIPYYIGYFTAYNYWGFTEQVPQSICVLNTKKSYKIAIGNTSYEAIKISKDKYYGVQKIKIEGKDVFISDKERTLVDLVFNPIGSIYNVMEILKNTFDKINADKFIRYLIRFPVVSVRKRAGYMLESIGYKGSPLKRLKKSLGNQNTYIVFDSSRKTRKGKINKEWKVIVNR